jgi:transcriptional regulator GlxA family with amidase domain
MDILSMPNTDQKVPSRLILILAFPGVQIIDVAGPTQVFTTANEEGATPPYEVRVVAFRDGPVETASGVGLVATAIPAVEKVDTVMVPGGPGVHEVRQDSGFIAALQALLRRTERVCAVCTGAFLLAETGVLDKRTAVTHWRSCERFAREFPSIRVDPAPLFMNDGPIWTTAGVTAGIDLSLELVQRDHDPALAARIARRLVVYMRRPGGQKQYSEPLALQIADASPYRELTQHIVSNPVADWTVERMAEIAGQSLRTFHRRFQSATGVTPAEAVEKVRCELARSLLHTTDLGFGQIAVQAGFRSEIGLRRAMIRQFGIGPNEMRKRFA